MVAAALNEHTLRTISLKIESASGIKSARFHRVPKVLVQITVDGQIYATSLSKRTTSPVWDEEFTVLLQSQSWTAEFRLLDKLANGNVIGQCLLSHSHFESLFLSKNEESSTRQLVELTSGRGPSPIKLQIVVTQILVSSPRSYLLESIHEHSRLDISRIAVPPAPPNNALSGPGGNTDITTSILSVMSSISQLKPVIDQLATVHPYVNLAWQIMTAAYNIAAAQRQRDQRVVALVTSMQNAIRWLISLDPLTKIEILENSFSELFSLCCQSGVFVQWYCSNSLGGRIVRDIMSDVEQRIETLENSFRNSIENFKMALRIQTAVTTTNIDQENKVNKANSLIQSHLPFESATWNPTLTCLKGTRENILQEIFAWVDDESGRNVFWLAGLAGSGKSTIAHTVASALASRGRLGGCFFFSRHQSKRNEASLVMPTLAHGIAAFSENIRDSVAEAIRRNIHVANAPLRRQFLDLIVEPLKSYSQRDPIVIVLDALDECATPAIREDLLTILAHDSTQLPSSVRIFITARPEQDIEKAFSFTTRCHKHAINLDSPSNINDITIYTTHQLAKIALSKGIKGEWPSEIRRRELVRRSAGLFIWAATACEFVRRSFSPEKALDRLLSEELPTSATAAIDSLYATALQAIEGWQDEDFIPAYQVVVGTVIALKNPLPSDTIELLLGPGLNGASVNRVVSSLGCVLSGSASLPIRVLHPSFSDYLTSQSRCKDKETYIDVSQNHYRLSRSILHLLNSSLDYNICKLTHPGQSVSDRLSTTLIEDIPSHLQYACQFWAEHVVQAPHDDDLLEEVHEFLVAHGLHWMEAMSLTGLTGYIKASLHLIRIWAQNLKASDLERLGYDLERFSQTFSNVLVDFPLHIYASALPFVPRGSSFQQQTFVKDEIKALKVLRGFDESWPRCSQILEGHEGRIRCVAFSPKGMLASGADDATVRIWDLSGGTSYIELKGHEQAVTSIAFSSNGNKIITGSTDKLAIIWDTASGERLVTLKGHRLPITSVAFTSDRTQAITASVDKTIRIWDASLGSQLGAPITTQQNEITSISVSSTTNLLASGSADGTVCIISLADRKKTLDPLSHGSGDAKGIIVTSAVFSHNDKVAASAYRDGTVNIWDVSTGEKHKSINVSSRPVTSVQFIQDDTTIVVGCNDRTLSLWNVDTGAMILGSPIEGHLDTVSSVALSIDGSIIASGSHDAKIRVWEYLECIKSPPTLQDQGHQSEITVITFSGDYTLVASGDRNGTICTWKSMTGEMLQCIPDAHRGPIKTLAFSTQLCKLVSGGEDAVVTCWSLDSGKMLWTSQDTTDFGHARAVSASVFNNADTMVATGGYDRYIFLWDAETGELLIDEPLEKDDGHLIERLAFSSDDTKLLSVDRNESRAQWDIDSKVLIEEEEEEAAENFIDQSASVSKLTLDESGWVVDCLTSNRLFWIPADHRGNLDAWTNSRERFIIGNKHGVVTIIDFSKLYKPK